MPQISPRNPACKLLGIEGTKPTRTKANPASMVKSTISQNAAPMYAKQDNPEISKAEEIIQQTEQESDKEILRDIAEKIASTSLKKDAAIYNFKESNAQFMITINKNKAENCSQLCAQILSDLKTRLPKMAKTAIVDQPAEFTYGQGDNTIDVSITLKTKPKSATANNKPKKN
jgi:hypothetical protein